MKKKILVCDEHPAILEVVKQILEDRGHEVHLSDSGTVIELMENTQPSLLLIEYRLTKMNGEQVVRKIRSEEKWQHLPIVAFSAWKNSEQMMMEAGADFFIPKPFDLDDLNKAMEISVQKAAKRLSGLSGGDFSVSGE